MVRATEASRQIAHLPRECHPLRTARQLMTLKGHSHCRYLRAAERAGAGEGGGQKSLGEAQTGEQASGGAHGLNGEDEEEGCL